LIAVETSDERARPRVVSRAAIGSASDETFATKRFRSSAWPVSVVCVVETELPAASATLRRASALALSETGAIRA